MSGKSISRGMGLLAALLLWGCGARPEAATRATDVKAEAAGAPEASGAKEVKLKTADGWTIVGDLYAPSGSGKGAVVLLHQRGGQASDWVVLCQALQKAGIAALAIDQRGAGRSTEGPGPTGDDAPWPTGPDIAAAIASLKSYGPVGLAGASYGANNALIYAAAHPDQVRGVTLFSPGADYHGLQALPAAKAYRGAAVIYHDRSDEIAGDGPRQINAALSGKNHILHVYDGSGHGTALLDTATIADAVRFFQRALK
jgi:pimeloyl-ACP methyl ester carboxylesterase